jgi:hypothetical protein
VRGNILNSKFGNGRIRGEIIIILRFERRVCRWESCRMHQFEEVESRWLRVDSKSAQVLPDSAIYGHVVKPE